jgi:hypothetical protein
MFNRVHGFPMGDHSGASGTEAGQLTMRYGIDKRYNGSSFENGTDLGVAYSMVREGEIPQNVRGIPVRLLWSKINHFQPNISSHRDSWHLSNELDRAVGAFLFTTLSGRCPVSRSLPSPIPPRHGGNGGAAKSVMRQPGRWHISPHGLRVFGCCPPRPQLQALLRRLRKR